jgi:hypothetical protein
LVGFGFDSAIEVTSSVAALRRLRWDADELRRETAERHTLRVIGGCFLLLAASPPPADAPAVPGLGHVQEVRDLGRAIALLWQSEAAIHMGRRVVISVMNASRPIPGTLLDVTDDGLLLEVEGSGANHGQLPTHHGNRCRTGVEQQLDRRRAGGSAEHDDAAGNPAAVERREPLVDLVELVGPADQAVELEAPVQVLAAMVATDENAWDSGRRGDVNHETDDDFAGTTGGPPPIQVQNTATLH